MKSAEIRDAREAMKPVLFEGDNVTLMSTEERGVSLDLKSIRDDEGVASLYALHSDGGQVFWIRRGEALYSVRDGKLAEEEIVLEQGYMTSYPTIGMVWSCVLSDGQVFKSDGVLTRISDADARTGLEAKEVSADVNPSKLFYDYFKKLQQDNQ